LIDVRAARKDKRQGFVLGKKSCLGCGGLKARGTEEGDYCRPNKEKASCIRRENSAVSLREERGT
jgi:hypothetical protein